MYEMPPSSEQGLTRLVISFSLPREISRFVGVSGTHPQERSSEKERAYISGGVRTGY